MKLESLKDVFDEVHEACRLVPNMGVFLCQEFKNEFALHIKSNPSCGYTHVDFGIELACFTNRNNQISYVPAPVFVLAHKLVRYYRVLIEYKSILSGVSPEEIKNAGEGSYSYGIKEAMKTADLDDESTAFFKRFLSDGLWWGKGKGIDRSDFYISPIVKCAGLQAESQSAIADLTKIFAENQNLYGAFSFDENIHNEEMATQLKRTEHKPFNGEKEFDFSEDQMLLRLAAALRTKPFVILAGHSGTGKSRMVRKLAYMACCDEGLRSNGAPGNFCMVQVKPNWHDSSELLGYYSSLAQRYETTEFVRFICRAYAYPDVPFFVCMDEMNLAPVEQYFAEYLSAIESARDRDGVVLTDALVPREVYGTATNLGVDSTEAAKWIEEYGLTIPKNLFVVGTVNMDETTCQFSRKVLDRAMTIEMNEIDFDSFGQNGSEPSFSDTLKLTEAKKLLAGKCRAESLTDGQKKRLNCLKNVLSGTPFAVAYRFANEYALYTDSLNTFDNGGDENTAFDHMILMKVLPRIIGEKEVVKDIFEGRSGGGLKSLVGDNSLSRRKMDEILGRNESYLSFWP